MSDVNDILRQLDLRIRWHQTSAAGGSIHYQTPVVKRFGKEYESGNILVTYVSGPTMKKAAAHVQALPDDQFVLSLANTQTWYVKLDEKLLRIFFEDPSLRAAFQSHLLTLCQHLDREIVS